MITLFDFEFSYSLLALFGVVGVLVGMSKTGVHGAGLVAVPVLAVIFGGKNSSGLMLPLLIMADVFGVSYYHHHAQFSHYWKLLPWAIVGILIGVYVGSEIDDQAFRSIMGVIVFLSLGVMIWMERKNQKEVPTHWMFAAILGLLAGFTTMVGNLAGTAAALYLLSMRMPKNEFIGTAAWFFMTINVFKVPFHIWSWGTITLNSFLLDLLLLPAIVVGVVLGIWIVRKIPETAYRWFIIAMTAIAAIFMVI